jgi:hypothetical protein
MIAWLRSLTLGEEHSPRVFENRVLRRVFGPKRYEVTGEWTRLRIGSFMICTHKIFWGDQIKKNEMGEACSTHELEYR